jgi:flagellar basal body-associated protein FliL
MDRKEETNPRTEAWIIILAVAAALFTLGIVMMAFFMSS